jgi:hypothetical protein
VPESDLFVKRRLGKASKQSSKQSAALAAGQEMARRWEPSNNGSPGYTHVPFSIVKYAKLGLKANEQLKDLANVALSTGAWERDELVRGIKKGTVASEAVQVLGDRPAKREEESIHSVSWNVGLAHFFWKGLVYARFSRLRKATCDGDRVFATGNPHHSNLSTTKAVCSLCCKRIDVV